MKNTILFSTLLLALASYAQAAKPLTGCAARQAEVRQQIQYADAYNNGAQKAGLQKALNEIEQHCTDENLRAERQKKVQERTEKVAGREADLRDAQAGGNRRKIEKQQQKLQRARQALQEAQDALSK